MNLNERIMTIAANLLNEDTTSINTKSKAETIAEKFYEEFKKQLPEGYEAIYSPTVSENKAVCGAKTYNIPNIDIYNRNYKPTGQFSLPHLANPRRIDFEAEGAGDWCKGLNDNIMLAVHYPGQRRISPREILKDDFHVDKCVKNIINDFMNNG